MPPCESRGWVVAPPGEESSADIRSGDDLVSFGISEKISRFEILPKLVYLGVEAPRQLCALLEWNQENRDNNIGFRSHVVENCPIF